MSAYGGISKPGTISTSLLPCTTWHVKHLNQSLTMHHLTLATASALPQLIKYLHEVFTDVLVEGRTYPQEIADESSYTLESFETYFFSGDVFVAIKTTGRRDQGSEDGSESSLIIDDARAERSWEDCIAGFYYIKPNYPGRSSHICNGGFVVPKVQQSNGYGSVMAKSYLHYAPKLGYQASVFNLVYVNNVASVRLWEKLGFVKAGLIPRAGRLRKKSGIGEEYVDAWVFYKSFVKNEA